MSGAGHTPLTRLTPEARRLWEGAHPGYRTISAEGVACVLYMNPATGATELWPVEEIATANARRAAVTS